MCLLKSLWIKRYLDTTNNGDWKIFMHKKLHKYGNDLVFESDLDQHAIKQIASEESFLKDVLMSWIKIKNNYEEKNNISISKTVIWNNKLIKQNGRTLYYKEWYQKGIKLFEHIYDYRTKSYHSFNEIKYLYDIGEHNYLKYLTLINSIPTALKTKLRSENINQIPPEKLTDKLLKCKQTNKFLYSIQQRDILKPPSEVKWEHLFPNLINDIPWKTIYMQTYKITIDTSLRSFNYKFLLRIIPTNKYLYKCKIKPTNLCDFCNMEIETIEHLFWDCQKTQLLWNELNNFIASKSMNTVITKQEAFLGIHVIGKYSLICNFLILLMKFYVFSMKYRNAIPTFSSYKQYVLLREKIESQIALNSDKYESHKKKWQVINLNN